MYSNWRVAQQNNNLLGLPTRALLSLYNSKYSTNPVWVMNSGEDPRSGAITHSSYWKIKNKERNVDTIFSLMEVKEPRREKDKSKFEVGYKTTEEEVYVRGRGRGKYVCETCGIRCKKPSMLKKHIRTHTDLRPYKCKYCQFSFKTKGNLQKHMKSKSHYKVCIDQGISPVPTTVDESQIDEEALQAQCYLSKRAKIYDKSDESSRSLERDVSTTDDNDDDDDDEDYKMADDGDDDNAEGGEENDDNVMETSTQEEFLQNEDKLDQRVAAMHEADVTTTNSQHNTFLQSLGIIAKHRLDDNDHTQISQTGTSTLPLPIVTSLGISLENLHQFGVTSSLSTAGSSTDTTTTSSLSTVYGNLKVESEGHPSVTKDSDVIWGLLNLSDQSNKPTTDVNMIDKNVDNAGTSVEVNSTVKVSDSIEQTTQSSSGTVTSQVKVPQSNSFLPPYLSMAGTMKLKSTKSGPIIGQIIQNVTSKSSPAETSDNRAVTMPFQFQHPFPGSLGVMLTAGSDSKYSTVTSSDLHMTESQPSTIPTPSVSEQKFGAHEELMYIQIGNTQGEIDTIPAQIVNIDPAMFRGKSQDSAPEKPVSLPTENILQLRRVSDGLYVITTDTEIKTGTSVAMETQPGTSIAMDTPPGVIVSGSLSNIPSSSVTMPHRAWQLTDSVSHVTASGSSHVAGRNASHVTGSNSSHVTGSSSSHVTGSDGARFVCKICKAAFPEHHQLILHGNIHFLDSSRLKCEKCNLKFRSHAAYEKHLLSDQHSAMVQNKLLSPDSDDPRPYKCEPCHTAFRLKGHLTKHFRSRSHFKNFEALGHIPIGFWEKLENNVSEIEASTVEEFLAVIDKFKSSRNDASWDQGVIIENESENFDGGNDRVLVEVNEEAYEMDAIGDGEKYRAYPLPGVFVAESPKSDSEETSAVVPSESIKVKPHKCGLCGRGFEMVAELKTHLITHAELRPYVCEYCDAGFTNAQSLKIHLYTHTQETPYVCGMCGLKFPNIQGLTNHCKISHPPPGRSLSHVTVATNSSSSSSSKNIQPVEVTQTVPSEHVATETISQQDVNTSVVVMTTGQSDLAIATGQGHPDIVMATSHSASSKEHVNIKSESLDSTDSEKLYAVPVREMVVCGENEEMEETGEMSEIVITGENEDNLQESNIVHTADDDEDSVYDSNVEYIVGDEDISSDIGEQTDANVTLSPKVYDYVMEDNSVVVVDQEQEFTSVSPVVSMETGDQSETDDIMVNSVAMETNNTSAISSGYVTYIMSQSLATTSAINEIPITQYVTISENMVQSSNNVIYITENVMSTPENVPTDENGALVTESVIQQPEQVTEATPVSFHSSE